MRKPHPLISGVANTGFRPFYPALSTRLPQSVPTFSSFPLKPISDNEPQFLFEWPLLKWIALVGIATGFAITLLSVD